MMSTVSTVRERIEAQEALSLHPHAQRAALSEGHHQPIEPCPYRTAYQRDRDRILHSKAFRRLKHKTQVFISPTGDHYRTRLTHSLEVSQIARTVARALRLNEDLTEAIALGHDLGHPPFGHSGEAALDRLSPSGFSHTDHSVRLVTVLEPLNLSLETLQGLEQQRRGQIPRLLEGQVVEVCDRMAYLHHDVQDAERAGLMSERDLPTSLRHALGSSYGERLERMVGDLIVTSATLLETDEPAVRLSDAMQAATLELRAWMFQHIYLSPGQREKDAQVQRLLGGLWDWYNTRTDLLPEGPYLPGLAERQVLDYLAGMTDRFALRAFEEQLLPGRVI